MPLVLRPTEPDDLGALSRFLTAAFKTPADAPFATPAVLGWKAFDPTGGPPLPRSWVALEDGRIVAHIGAWHASFLFPGGPAEGVPAVHPTDWVVAEGAAGAGIALLRKVQPTTAVQYAIGLTSDSAAIAERLRYEVRLRVPVFRRVFRPLHRLRSGEGGAAGRLLRAGGDAVELLRRPVARAAGSVDLEPVGAFGPEVEAIADRLRGRSILTRRDPELLDHMIRYPGGPVTGWTIRRGGSARGFALLSIVEAGGARVGRIADCVLDDPAPDAWHAAIAALTAELRRRGADLAEAFGAAPWVAEGLIGCGYRERFTIPLFLRDRGGLLPRDVPIHLTQIEADYAYT